MSIAGGPDIVENGLVLHLDAADSNSYPGSGTTWYSLVDSSLSAVKAGSQSPTYPAYNKANNGYFNFTGGIVSNNYSRFDIANIPSFSKLSVFVWYRTSIIDGTPQTILRMDNSDFELSLMTGVSAPIRLTWAAGTNFNDIITWIDSNIAINTNWHYMGLTFNGTQVLGYFDGTLLSTSSVRASSISTAAGTLKIGTRNDAYNAHLVGDIASIKIYNQILSANEILQNYNATKGRFGL